MDTKNNACTFTPNTDKKEAILIDQATSPKTIVNNSAPREFVIGDPHFYDPNIIHFCDRDFDNVKEMNEFMIDCWNSVVKRDDTVFVLGDFFDMSNCDQVEVEEIVNRLNGNIILIVGNHDTHLERFANTQVAIIKYPIVKDGFWIMSHEPMFVTTSAPYANIFAHVHTNPMYKTVSNRSYCVSAERLNYIPALLSEIKTAVKESVD